MYIVVEQLTPSIWDSGEDKEKEEKEEDLVAK